MQKSFFPLLRNLFSVNIQLKFGKFSKKNSSSVMSVFPSSQGSQQESYLTHWIGLVRSDEETIELQDGDSIKIFCNNQEQVEEMKIKWFLNDVEITGETRNFLEIEQFSKSYDKSKVKCTARTRNGVEEVKRVVQLVYREDNEDPKILPIKFRDIIEKKQSKRKTAA